MKGWRQVSYFEAYEARAKSVTISPSDGFALNDQEFVLIAICVPTIMNNTGVPSTDAGTERGSSIEAEVGDHGAFVSGEIEMPKYVLIIDHSI